MKLDVIWQYVKDAASAWVDDYAPSMGAALAYYTLFSLAPLLLLLIALAGAVFGADAARGQIVAELGGLMGKEGATAIEGLLKSASEPGKSAWAAAIGSVILLIGATTVFAELQSDLDRIWKVPAKDKPSGLWGLLRARVLSFGMILGVGFLMIVSLALSAGLTALGDWWGPYFKGWANVLQVINFVVSFAVVTAMFGMVYKLMPSVPIRWRDVWVGALVTAFLFTLGKYLIGLYIGKAGVASGFGAAGSLIVIIVWVYYSTQIFLLGAEFTHVFAERAGSHAAEPKRVAAENPTQTRDSVPAGARPAAYLRRGRSEPAPAPVGASLDVIRDFERASKLAYRNRKPPTFKTLAVRAGVALASGWVAGRLLRPEIRRGVHLLKYRALALMR